MLLGQLIDLDAMFRLRLIVKEKGSHQLPIAFYTDEKGQELDRALLREGYTVAILYAENHGFLDMT